MAEAAGQGLLARASVRRVVETLKQRGSGAEVVVLTETARTAADAARALDVPVGAIVKSLVFTLEGAAVMALVAGDRQCHAPGLATALGRDGAKVGRADADLVRAATGFAIGGVAPVGHREALPVVLDASLGRFERVYAAAGHPHCVFGTTLDELASLTGGTVSDAITGA
ncbi:YbaK/EbsC family protein [Marinivivus vitaminiproducens]|uniref:YbaK/EbsC family protein n=1 Tax=Marinivivus vitaminiproducens TaxID=3035935 RepID=UPI0027A33FA4|nr:YbaK/EbsC family protein [Geminicoccaceae bacterium SCSIO 64248]